MLYIKNRSVWQQGYLLCVLGVTYYMYVCSIHPEQLCGQLELQYTIRKNLKLMWVPLPVLHHGKTLMSNDTRLSALCFRTL